MPRKPSTPSSSNKAMLGGLTFGKQSILRPRILQRNVSGGAKLELVDGEGWILISDAAPTNCCVCGKQLGLPACYCHDSHAIMCMAHEFDKGIYCDAARDRDEHVHFQVIHVRTPPSAGRSEQC